MNRTPGFLNKFRFVSFRSLDSITSSVYSAAHENNIICRAQSVRPFRDVAFVRVHIGFENAIPSFKLARCGVRFVRS